MKWIVGGYYLAAFLIRPVMTCQWPFQTDDLILFGVIPAAAGMIGIMTSRYHGARVLAWSVFILGTIGIVLSFIPWKEALFART